MIALPIDDRWRMPEELWKKMEPLLPQKHRTPRGRRSQMSNREVMEAIFYVLVTECAWRRLPRTMGIASTVYDRFLEWREDGVFERIWKERILAYENVEGRGWKWPVIGAVLIKAPLGPQKRERFKAEIIRFDGDLMTVVLTDGRTIQVPVKDFPRLHRGTPEQREQWEFIGDGEAVHWEELDEDLGVEGLIRLYGAITEADESQE